MSFKPMSVRNMSFIMKFNRNITRLTHLTLKTRWTKLTSQ